MQHSTAFKQLCDEYRSQINEIDNTTVKQWLVAKKPFVLIDVREADEFAAGHLDNAVHLSKGWLEAKIHNTVSTPETTIVLYCGGGNRSVLAAYNLQKMGYCNVYSMVGGYKNWVKDFV